MGEEEDRQDRPFVTRIGPIDVDWMRSLGYFGAIAVAVGFELIAPELGLFIAAVPLVKLLRRKNASIPERALAAIVEGAAKPVGGDAESTIRPASATEEIEKRERGMEAVEKAVDEGDGAATDRPR